MHDNIEIPSFLKRTKDKPMTQKPDRKTRQKTVLPSHIDAAGGKLELMAMSLPELIEHKFNWEKSLASMPNLTLELRAINAAIRAKAR